MTEADYEQKAVYTGSDTDTAALWASDVMCVLKRQLDVILRAAAP